MFGRRWQLSLLLAAIGISNAAWLFGSTEEPAAEIIGFRGLHPSLQQKYEQSAQLECDGGTKVFTKSQINDNYCDCLDGTDEPGTSACNGATFVCANRGYRSVSITSARVDDGVCDCADGTDEGTYIKCPNTSKAAAAREKEMIQKVTKAYQVGSSKRASMYTEFVKSKEEVIAKIGPLSAEADHQRAVVDRFRDEKDATQRAHDDKVSAIEDGIKSAVRATLNLDQMSEEDLAKLLSVVFTVLNLTDEEVRSAAVAAGVPTRYIPDYSRDHDHDHDYRAPFDDSSAEGADGDSDADAGEGESDQPLPELGDEDRADGTPPADPMRLDHEPENDHYDHPPPPPPPPPPCLLSDHTGDKRLAIICTDEHGGDREVGNKDNARDLLMGLVRTRELHRELQLIRGYEKVEGSLDNVVTFVQMQLSSGTDTCAAVFANVHVAVSAPDGAAGGASTNTMEACLVSQRLAELHKGYETLPTLDRNVENAYYEADTRLREIDSQADEARKVKKEMDQYGEFAEYLALRDQNRCFDTVDGKFTYSVCVMQRVTQKEGEGGDVELGVFSSVEVNEETGGAVLHYTGGAHCWGLNEPRRADVFVVCGEEDKVLTATEPSTCYYTFQMESPAACTDKFAAIHDLV